MKIYNKEYADILGSNEITQDMLLNNLENRNNIRDKFIKYFGSNIINYQIDDDTVCLIDWSNDDSIIAKEVFEYLDRGFGYVSQFLQTSILWWLFVPKIVENQDKIDVIVFDKETNTEIIIYQFERHSVSIHPRVMSVNIHYYYIGTESYLDAYPLNKSQLLEEPDMTKFGFIGSGSNDRFIDFIEDPNTVQVTVVAPEPNIYTFGILNEFKIYLSKKVDHWTTINFKRFRFIKLIDWKKEKKIFLNPGISMISKYYNHLRINNMKLHLPDYSLDYHFPVFECKTSIGANKVAGGFEDYIIIPYNQDNDDINGDFKGIPKERYFI